MDTAGRVAEVKKFVTGAALCVLLEQIQAMARWKEWIKNQESPRKNIEIGIFG